MGRLYANRISVPPCVDSLFTACITTPSLLDANLPFSYFSTTFARTACTVSVFSCHFRSKPFFIGRIPLPLSLSKYF
ncbi:hypothetical protein EVA_14120 [gut metagenome]|uniref:Uncharacterized protein n=1 Tax=gut metagenome TaxID=749906 RepID=J9FTE3_9ZZZZ